MPVALEVTTKSSYTRPKRVFIEFPWGSHSYYRSLSDNPPEGYEFIAPPEPKWLAHTRLMSPVRVLHLDLAERLLPMNRLRTMALRWSRPPTGTDLTFAVNHVVLRDEPWIFETEHGAFPVSYRVERLNSARHRRWIEAALRSPNCKRIISFTRAAERTVQRNLDCTGFEHKFTIVPLAVAVPPVPARHAEGARPRVLFVGSANLSGMFYDKGGPELVRTLELVHARHPEAELTVRAEVPPAERRALQAIGARVLDELLSREQMDELYRGASVFLYPGHHTPWTTVLEAMGYGLPVVATDAHANPELLRDGETGFLVPRSKHVPHIWSRFVNDGDRVASVDEYRQAIRQPDERVAGDLAERVSLLLDDLELRRRMGPAARAEVERGTHSIAHRNALFKQVLDEATQTEQAVPAGELEKGF